MIGHGSKKGMTCAKLDALRDTSKVVTDYDGCAYITAGKEYDLMSPIGSLRNRSLVDDEGDIISPCIGGPSNHLDYIGVFYHPLRT